MSSLIEKFQQEIEKGQAERLAYEQDIMLNPNNPANLAKIRAAKMFHRKVGAGIALLGLALISVTYGFYIYSGDLYLILGLLGIVALCFGACQTVVGKTISNK